MQRSITWLSLEWTSWAGKGQVWQHPEVSSPLPPPPPPSPLADTCNGAQICDVQLEVWAWCRCRWSLWWSNSVLSNPSTPMIKTNFTQLCCLLQLHVTCQCRAHKATQTCLHHPPLQQCCLFELEEQPLYSEGRHLCSVWVVYNPIASVLIFLISG